MSHFPVGTVVRAMPANSRSVRGLSASLIILAEFAHFADTAGPASDERMFQASEPSTESSFLQAQVRSDAAPRVAPYVRRQQSGRCRRCCCSCACRPRVRG